MRTRTTVVQLLLLLITSASLSASSAANLESESSSDLSATSPLSTISDQEIYFDADGLIVHRDNKGRDDGGDTAQREGWYWLGVKLRESIPGLPPWPHKRELSFKQVLDLLEPAHDGVFYRHPRDPRFNVPNRKKFGTSRDQLEPLVAAMGVWGEHDAIRRLWAALPTSLLGKHAFNGEYKSLGGDVARACNDLLGFGCDAPISCTPSTVDLGCEKRLTPGSCKPKSCKKYKPKKCSLHKTKRDPILHKKVKIPNPDYPKCVAENAKRQAGKIKCEFEREATRISCEAWEAHEDLRVRAQYDVCRESESKLRESEDKLCGAQKAANELRCELNRQLGGRICEIALIHDGDLITPMSFNLFRRALGEDPLAFASTLTIPGLAPSRGTLIPDLPGSIPTSLTPNPIYLDGSLGESELSLNVETRLACSSLDGSDTGDDLNLIVKLLMSKVAHPSILSAGAAARYSSGRTHSWGSYYAEYLKKYGTDWKDEIARMTRGVKTEHWVADTTPAIGAIRWYHRPSKGANPRLAELYEPILTALIGGSVDGAATSGNDRNACKKLLEKLKL